MKEIEILKSELACKAYLHPLRSKILGLITSEPMTVTQVARHLEVHPANITHHFRNLQKAGLIKIHEERDIGRVIERYYIAIARTFEIQQKTKGANSKVLTFLKNDLSATIPKIKSDDSELVIGLIKKSKIDKSAFKLFAKKLEKLIEEFSNQNMQAKSSEQSEMYALNVSLYPHCVDYGPLKKIQIKKEVTSK